MAVGLVGSARIVVESRSFDQGNMLVVKKQHQVVRNENGARNVDVSYRVLNRSGLSLNLRVVSKSCVCLRTTIPARSLAPGQAGIVSIRVGVNELTAARGWTILGVREARGFGIPLSFEVRPSDLSGLRCAPREILVSKDQVFRAGDTLASADLRLRLPKGWRAPVLRVRPATSVLLRVFPWRENNGIDDRVARCKLVVSSPDSLAFPLRLTLCDEVSGACIDLFVRRD